MRSRKKFSALTSYQPMLAVIISLASVTGIDKIFVFLLCENLRLLENELGVTDLLYWILHNEARMKSNQLKLTAK